MIRGVSCSRPWIQSKIFHSFMLFFFTFFIVGCWFIFVLLFLKLVCSGSVKKTLYEVGLIYNLQPKLKTFLRLLCPLIDWGNYMTIEEMLPVELPGTYPINPFAGLQNTWPNQYKLSMLLPITLACLHKHWLQVYRLQWVPPKLTWLRTMDCSNIRFIKTNGLVLINEKIINSKEKGMP